MYFVLNLGDISSFTFVQDINENGYIDLEELRLAVEYLMHDYNVNGELLSSDGPCGTTIGPNIEELFNAIDITQNGKIEFHEFKIFYESLLTHTRTSNDMKSASFMRN